MMMRSIVYYVTFLFFISTFSFPVHCINETVFVEGGFESSNAFINYVVINGVRYIIKQKKECSKTRISVIRDALASYIARKLKIAHSVEIISPEDDISGKIYQHCPATLLTVAPGKIIRHLGENHKFFTLSLQQRNLEELDEKILNKWLDATIISQITWHKQLPVIVALDIFLCNSDRHRGNLFYDDETDSFCAIDMDNIYRRNLPAFAYQNLEKMINIDKKKFTQEEIQAITKMKKTLEFLLQNYTPKKIIAQLYTFARQAGYVDDGSEVNKSITKKIKSHKKIIKQSYQSSRKLISLLDGIIAKSYDNL
jgi:hypothetical protein